MLAVVLIALGIGLFWVEWGNVKAPESESDARQVQNVAGAVDIEADDRQSEDQVAEASTEREAIASKGLAGRKDSVLIEVVYADSGLPAVGAKIYLKDEKSDHWQQQLPEIEATPPWEKFSETLLLRFGQEFITDAEGMTWLPPSPSGSALHGVDGKGNIVTGYMGMARENRIRLELVPIFEFAIHLMQEDGQFIPQAPISVMGQARGGVAQGRSTMTDDRGIARISLSSYRIVEGLDVWDTFTVGVKSPLGRFDKVPVERDPAASEPYPVRIKAGSIEFVVPEAAQVGLGSDRVILKRDGGSNRYGRQGPPERVVHGDRVAFHCVPLEAEFTAELQVAATGESYRARGRGPQRSGESVVMQLEPWAGPPVVAVKLLGWKGGNGEEPRLRATHYFPEHGYGGKRVVDGLLPNEDGTVHLFLDHYNDKGAHSVFFRTGPGLSGLTARIELGKDYPPGLSDWGEVELVEAPVVFAGRIIQPSGEGLARTSLRLRWSFADEYPPQSETISQVLPDDEGFFEVRSLSRPEHVTLTPQKKGWFTGQDWQVAYGDSDVKVVLEEGGGIKALVLSSLRASEAPKLKLIDENGAEGAKTYGVMLRDQNDGGWELTAEGLPPSSYRLEVRPQGSSLLLESYPSIPVQAGETTELDDINLVEVLRSLYLELVDAEGAVIPGVKVSVRPMLESKPWKGKTDRLGRMHIQHWGEGLDVTVDAGERAYLELDDFQESQRIVLAPMQLRLFLEEDMSFLSTGQVLRVHLRPWRDEEFDYSSWKGAVLHFDDRVKVQEVSVPTVHGLELAWSAGMRGSTNFVAMGVSELDVEEDAGSLVKVGLPPEILSKLQEWARTGR